MRRIVVTGLGLVTPLGGDVETTWANILAAKSGAGTITRFDASDQKCRIACEVKPKDHAYGFDPDKRRDDRPIVCVQLPARTTANTSGGDLSPYAADALWYIRDRADDIGRSLGLHPLPVVINFSYGAIGGPHDGTSDLELLMDALIRERMAVHGVPLEIVLPAGNSHLLRCHAEIALSRACRDQKTAMVAGPIRFIRWFQSSSRTR